MTFFRYTVVLIVMGVSLLPDVARCQPVVDIGGAATRPFDLKDTSTRYYDDFMEYLDRKYGLTDSTKLLPPGLQKLGVSYARLLLLVKDQGISEEEFIRYRVFDRLPPIMYAALELDTLGRLSAAIGYEAKDARDDSSCVQRLRALDVAIREVNGRSVYGYVPVYKVEEIFRDPRMKSIYTTPMNYHPLHKQPVVLHGIILLAMLLLTILSFVPTRVKIDGNTWFHYLPLLSIPLYAWYEWTMPGSIDIRVDLLFVYPMLLICVASSLRKYFAIASSRQRG